MQQVVKPGFCHQETQGGRSKISNSTIDEGMKLEAMYWRTKQMTDGNQWYANGGYGKVMAKLQLPNTMNL